MPEPFWPRMATHSPRAISKLIPRSASTRSRRRRRPERRPSLRRNSLRKFWTSTAGTCCSRLDSKGHGNGAPTCVLRPCARKPESAEAQHRGAQGTHSSGAAQGLRPSALAPRVGSGARRRRRAPRQWGLGTLVSPGAFFVGPTRRRRHVRAGDEALHRERGEGSSRRTRGDRVGRADAGAARRPEVLRPARALAAHDAAAERIRRVRVRRGPRLRRLVDPRLAGHLGVGHAAHARSGERDPRPVHRGADALADLRDRRPGHPRAVRARPARRGQAGRGLSQRDGHRRHGLHGPRVRVLRLRRGLLRPRPEPLALRVRLRRGPLELGQARAREHDPREGGLLPARAARHAARPALGDGAHARAARHPVRVPPPRGRLRRPVRDRPPLPDADPHGRSGHDLQVRGQERRARGRARP